jgi:hypothetical protein
MRDFGNKSRNSQQSFGVQTTPAYGMMKLSTSVRRKVLAP